MTLIMLISELRSVGRALSDIKGILKDNFPSESLRPSLITTSEAAKLLPGRGSSRRLLRLRERGLVTPASGNKSNGYLWEPVDLSNQLKIIFYNRGVLSPVVKTDR